MQPCGRQMFKMAASMTERCSVALQRVDLHNQWVDLVDSELLSNLRVIVLRDFFDDLFNDVCQSSNLSFDSRHCNLAKSQAGLMGQSSVMDKLLGWLWSLSMGPYSIEFGWRTKDSAALGLWFILPNVSKIGFIIGRLFRLMSHCMNLIGALCVCSTNTPPGFRMRGV